MRQLNSAHAPSIQAPGAEDERVGRGRAARAGRRRARRAWSGAIWRPCGPTTHKTAAKLPRQRPARHRNLSYASGLPLSSRVARPWEGRPPSQERVGRVLGRGLRSTLAAGAKVRSGRAGWCGGRGSELVAGAGQSWWSIEFDQSISDWLGRCFYPHPRACAGRGWGREGGPDWGGGCLWRVCLCGACSGHLSAVSRAALRPTRILLSDIMASTRAPPPVAPRRAVDGGGGLHLGLLDVLVFMHSRHARPPV